jgi:23S rRNA pseudouridine2605 synthase
MRINTFVAISSGLSRRAADQAILAGRVQVNQQPSELGQQVSETAVITFDGHRLYLPKHTTTIMLNKPIGYVCSRNGQGSKTIYELLPTDLHRLKPVGRLDKDSSGLLLLTNNGTLANELTHPSKQKVKVYDLTLNKYLEPSDKAKIEHGVMLGDGLSKLELKQLNNPISWQITMREGRNRQIRRTFAAIGYTVTSLHRISLGEYQLADLGIGKHVFLPQPKT